MKRITLLLLTVIVVLALGAQAALEEAAGHWAARRGADVAVGHSTLGTPTIADALTAHPTASVARYVLFPGALTDRIARAAEGRASTPPPHTMPHDRPNTLRKLSLAVKASTPMSANGRTCHPVVPRRFAAGRLDDWASAGHAQSHVATRASARLAGRRITWRAPARAASRED